MHLGQAISAKMMDVPIHDLIDGDVAGGRFRVRSRIYNDPALFELERERIFARSWAYLCHESQIRQAGDYVATEIAGRPVFAIRDATGGGLNAFYDRCSHRGARLTTRRYGTARTLTCRYHGWCFNPGGRCIKIQYETLGWPDGLPPNLNTNLKPLPRVAAYRGFLFASLASEGPPLEAELGASARFLDTMVDQSPNGIEVLPGSIRYVMRANWKFQSENGADGYHVAAVHRNYAAAMAFREQIQTAATDPLKATEAGRILNRAKTVTGSYDLGLGHMVNWSERVNIDAVPLGETQAALLSRLDGPFVHWMLRRGRVLTIFPNLLVNDVASTAIRVWRPVGPGETELETWCFAPIGESARARAARIRKFEEFFLPSSLAVPDDVAAMEGAHEGNLADQAAWIEFDRGRASMVDGADIPAQDLGIVPASSNSQGDSETCLFGFYRQWRQMMGQV